MAMMQAQNWNNQQLDIHRHQNPDKQPTQLENTFIKSILIEEKVEMAKPLLAQAFEFSFDKEMLITLIKRGLSKNHIANKTGISRRTINRIISGEIHTLNPRNFFKLISFYALVTN